jgi:quinol-cytochrome oxidoreductase complex cytochrome b subunit
MPLKAEVHFDLRPDGVAVRLVLWTTSNVFVDTGESRFIDAMIDRLFNADLERQPPPVVQNISGNASSSLYISFVLIAAPFLFFLPWFDMERSKSLMGGIFLAFITNLVMGGLGLRDTIMRPSEMSGKWRAVVGILLSFVAVGVTLVVFAIARFGEIASGRY